jgi:hypothetical protein
VVTRGTVAAEIDHRVMLVPAGNSFTIGTGQSLVLTAIEEDAHMVVVAPPSSTINLERLFATPEAPVAATAAAPRSKGEPLSEVA